MALIKTYLSELFVVSQQCFQKYTSLQTFNEILRELISMTDFYGRTGLSSYLKYFIWFKIVFRGRNYAVYSINSCMFCMLLMIILNYNRNYWESCNFMHFLCLRTFDFQDKEIRCHSSAHSVLKITSARKQ